MRTIRILALLAALLVLAAGCETRDGRGAASPVAATERVTEPATEMPPTEPETEPEEEETEPADTEGARGAAEELLAALKSGEPDAIRAEIDYTNLLLLDDGAPESSQLAILKKLEYEILDVSAAEDSATVTARLSNISIESFFADYLQKCNELQYNNALLGEERVGDEELDAQMQQLFYDALDANEENRTETTVVLQLAKSAGEWRARVSEALRDAATGGYFDARKQTAMGG